MGGGGGRVACTVLKELLQNADDAGASEVSVLLDERDNRRVVELCPGYEALCTPALLVRNNRHFRLPGERKADDRGDFAAICDVAVGHKRAQATAAGRFGIGFNSVYFLTDTPLLFSRREIHIFDLLHRIFEDDGWRFPLDQFPRSSGSLVGPIKEVLDWCLPVAVLESDSLGNIAGDPRGDYMQSVFRLPLRQSQDGQAAIYDDRFGSEVDRNGVILDMIQEAVRSIIFLKNVCTVSFGILRDRQAEMVTTIKATPPPHSFTEFLGHVVGQSGQAGCSPGRECEFERVVTREPFQFQGVTQKLEEAWRFHVRHVARYDEAELGILRARLELNGERAVPWAAVAVPLDVQGCCVDGGKSAKWRVFLPLLEEGPSACLIHGAFFVGRNRHQTDFRIDGSDEGKRKTEWNKRLFECAVLPLLQDISADLPDLAPELLAQHPGEYLSLFPVASKEDGEATDLTEFARRCFAAGPWELHLKDVWNGGLDLLVGADGPETIVEMIPEGLVAYRERFRELSSDRRRFVTHALGKALWARVGAERGIAFRWQADVDVLLRILRHAEAPRPEDLERLLKVVVAGGDVVGNLEAAWAFQEAAGEELLRFEGERLYILEETGADPVIGHLRGMGLDFEEVEWVRAGVGLAGLLGDIHPALKNVWRPTAEAALELLRRLPEANRHDQVAHDYEIRPVVDFLVGRPQGEVTADLRLGFLVRTAHAQAERRGFGVILLKPGKPTATEDALWEVWFQRVFAHLDPEFQRELQRLTAKHPGGLEALHAADCRVVVAHDRQAFDILHGARLKEPAVCAKLEEEMAAAAKKHPEAAERVSAWLLENADAAWEEMDEARRYTVLALPIHRCSDGQFIALSAASGGEMGSAGREFRLQSEDDIEDAPITLPACRILQSANSLVKRFYRLRLGIKVHGRIEVLKETLRQIGEAELDNLKLLRYLDRYYEASLRALDQSGDVGDAADAHELRALMSAARTVPCLDGKWRTAAECGEAWQVADHLARQGWAKKELSLLLPKLLWGQNVASIEAQVRELLPRLHKLDGCDTREIVELAITSKCPELGLGERVKLFWDNRRDFPDAGVVCSEAAGMLSVPALGGPVALAESELVAGAGDMPGGVLRLLAPKAIALPSLASQLGSPGLQVKDLLVVLRAFGVSEVGASDLDDRLAKLFGAVWPRLGQEDWIGLLRYIDTRGLTARLAEEAARLETVQVGGRKPSWKAPADIISPQWAATEPPHVGAERVPAAEKVPEAVRHVWEGWCRLRTFGDVLDLVMEGATRAGQEERRAGKAVYRWLEKVIGRSAKEEELAVLKTRAWVLAQRGEILQFKKPEEVLIHPGEKVLGARFWVHAPPLPEFCRRGSERLGFATAPSATAADLVEIGECLVERADAEGNAAVRVYELVVR
jgi:hypothetical protein